MYHASKFSQQALYKLATEDTLTGLANRALFLDNLRQQIKKSLKYQSYFAVFMIDMDGLKKINDAYGHKIGDIALKEIANRIKKCVRQDDTVARLGGDEFAVMLSAQTQQMDLASLKDRMIHACSKPFNCQPYQLNLAISIGVAYYPMHGSDPESLLEHADLEMYINKRLKKEH